MASPSISLGSGSRTLLGFLGEVGSSAGRRRGSREMMGINGPYRIPASHPEDWAGCWGWGGGQGSRLWVYLDTLRLIFSSSVPTI